MAIKTIKINREACITASSCVAIAPNVFEIDDEGKAVLKDTKGADENTILEAAKSCPVDAIVLEDENGKQIWPEK